MPARRGLVAACGALALLMAGCGGMPARHTGGPACLARLEAQHVAYSISEPRDTGDPACRVDTAVRVRRAGITLDHPATMSCALAERLDRFDREVVQPLALAEFGRRAARLDHLGSYSCRRLGSALSGRFSEHARGQAIDVSGYRLSDGTLLSIERDWFAPGRKQLFLRQIARQACQYFSVVLTPDSNAEHRNHFHFDIGPDRLCSA